MKLPPLPTSSIRGCVPGTLNVQAVEELMRERDQQIVELCAQIAENTHPGEWAFIGSAIRALKEPA
jgi:hypothetical protein